MNTLTVLPFLLAMAIAVAAMPTDVVQVNAWGLGHEHTLPWRSRAMASLRNVAGALSWFSRLWGSRTACASLAALLALLAVQLGLLDPSVLSVAVLGTVAEPTLAEVKSAIEASNRVFTEFKEANAARMKALEEGRAVDPLLTAKLEKLNKAMDDQSAINEAFMSLQAKVNKLQLAGGDVKGEEARALELRTFNRAVRAVAAAAGRSIPAEVTQDGYEAYKGALDIYMRRGDRGLTDTERKALSVGTETEGGFLVTPDRTGRIIERIYETSPMRQYASQQTIGTDALEGMADLDEAACGWVSELGTRSESNTAQVPAPYRIPVHEIYAQPRASQKLLEDANIDVAAWHGRKASDKISRTSNTAFVTGNGVGKPRGFASYTTAATADASRAWGTFEHLATAANGSFGTDPVGVNTLLNVIHAMKDQYLANAAWYMNRTTLGKARQLTDASSAGKYVFIPSFVAGMPDTFLGYTLRKLQDMATYSTTDALAVAFGDMAETYQIVDRLGITVLVDPYTAKPYVIFYTRARVGGDVVNFDSLKFVKFGS